MVDGLSIQAQEKRHGAFLDLSPAEKEVQGKLPFTKGNAQQFKRIALVQVHFFDGG